MENPASPKRAALIYASLSLIVRLIAAQSSVFSLWYGRRCYERSRGEMVTMLFEKTLSRKVVSISSKAKTEENSETSNGHTKKADEAIGWRKSLGHLTYLLRPCCGSRTKSKTAKKNELASMGKILNLMRLRSCAKILGVFFPNHAASRPRIFDCTYLETDRLALPNWGFDRVYCSTFQCLDCTVPPSLGSRAQNIYGYQAAKNLSSC
jgi:hypothetical protein